MKVKDLINLDIDIDVVDDVVEELYIAFVGPLTLTEEGKRKFEEVLEFPVDMNVDGPMGPVAIIGIDDDEDSVWEARLEKAIEFFESAAGLCSSKEYDSWFKE